MNDAAEIATYAFAFRIGERIVISLVVVLVSLVVTVGFWKSIQRVDFQLTRDKLSGAGNLVLATPVFALLALIGFAWVSFSNPISIGLPGTRAPDGAGTAAAADGGISLTAASPLRDAAPDPDLARSRALATVRSLNCVRETAGDLSPRDRDALVAARLAVMAPVWGADWGDAAAFAAWAEGLDSGPPDPAARAFFEATHPVC